MTAAQRPGAKGRRGRASAAGGAEAPAGDAVLVALCRQHSLLERRLRAYGRSGACPDDAAYDAMAERVREVQAPLLDALLPLRATTAEGLRARLRAVVLADAGMAPARLLASG